MIVTNTTSVQRFFFVFRQYKELQIYNAAFKVANSVYYDMPLKFKMSLSKLKFTVHDLNVETGRDASISHKQ